MRTFEGVYRATPQDCTLEIVMPPAEVRWDRSWHPTSATAKNSSGARDILNLKEHHDVDRQKAMPGQFSKAPVCRSRWQLHSAYSLYALESLA